jgi:hypothetical protein
MMLLPLPLPLLLLQLFDEWNSSQPIASGAKWGRCFGLWSVGDMEGNKVRLQNAFMLEYDLHILFFACGGRTGGRLPSKPQRREGLPSFRIIRCSVLRRKVCFRGDKKMYSLRKGGRYGRKMLKINSGSQTQKAVNYFTFLKQVKK